MKKIFMEMDEMKELNSLLNNNEDILDLLESVEGVFGLEEKNIISILETVKAIKENEEDEDSLNSFADLDEKLELISEFLSATEEFPNTTNIMKENSIFSYTRLRKVVDSGLSDSAACPALLISLQRYSCVDNGLDSLWEIAREMTVLNNDKALASRQWYYDTSGIDISILEKVDSDLVIDWEASFENIFREDIIVEYNDNIYRSIY